MTEAWWDYDEDGLGPDPKGWGSWLDLVAFEPPTPPKWEDDPDECPGPLKCHGCMKWCRWCGDVSNVCHADDADPGAPGCDIHNIHPPPKPLPYWFETSQLKLPFPEVVVHHAKATDWHTGGVTDISIHVVAA